MKKTLFALLIIENNKPRVYTENDEPVIFINFDAAVNKSIALEVANPGWIVYTIDWTKQ